MAWGWLILAGLLEVAWSQSIEPTANFTRPLPTLLCFTLAAVAVYPLTRAMRDIPAGTAYAVFAGLGAVGAIALGVIVHHEPVNLGRLAALALIVTGVVLARLVTT